MKRSLFFFMSAVMTLTSIASTVYVDSVRSIRDSSVVVGHTATSSDVTVEVRAAASGKKARWGIRVGQLCISLASGRSARGNFEERPVLRMMIERDGTVLRDTMLTDGFATESGEENSLAVTVSDRGDLVVEGGMRRLMPLAVIPDCGVSGEAPVSLFATGQLDIAMIAVETVVDPLTSTVSGWSVGALDEYFSVRRPLPEGRWAYLDAVTDEVRARRGGRYSLAVVASESGDGWDIIYLGGAAVNSDKWKPGMLKGHMRRTIFKDHYDVEWIDATFRPMTFDVSAQIEQGAILQFNFPRYKSTLRFSLSPR